MWILDTIQTGFNKSYLSSNVIQSIVNKCKWKDISFIKHTAAGLWMRFAFHVLFKPLVLIIDLSFCRCPALKMENTAWCISTNATANECYSRRVAEPTSYFFQTLSTPAFFVPAIKEVKCKKIEMWTKAAVRSQCESTTGGALPLLWMWIIKCFSQKSNVIQTLTHTCWSTEPSVCSDAALWILLLKVQLLFVQSVVIWHKADSSLSWRMAD